MNWKKREEMERKREKKSKPKKIKVKCCEPRSSGRKREQERKGKEEKIRQKPRREKLKVERKHLETIPLLPHHCPCQHNSSSLELAPK
jgi:hypothetical protein